MRGAWLALATATQLLGAACSNGAPKANPDAAPDAPAGDPPGPAARDTTSESPCPSYMPPTPIPGTCCYTTTTLAPVSPDTPCVFTSPLLTTTAPELAVYVDKALVLKDPANGWSYDATTSTVVFSGTACDALVAKGPSARVEVYCGCGGASVPPACIP